MSATGKSREVFVIEAFARRLSELTPKFMRNLEKLAERYGSVDFDCRFEKTEDAMVMSSFFASEEDSAHYQARLKKLELQEWLETSNSLLGQKRPGGKETFRRRHFSSPYQGYMRHRKLRRRPGKLRL